ncbi:zinc finger protein ZAT9 [Cajanus cajan]|nr:zinc finger protein ZAT9 [Cajanus cajan]
MMERQKCKLCSRSFSNGRALGGHMKAHLADTSSSSYSSDSDALRENPKKSFNSPFASLVQDRESESESKNPTRQRSNRSSEEHVAMCLIMLSRDTWHAPPPNTSRTGSNHLCLRCNKPFRSSRALASHSTICKNTHHQTHTKLFQCPFCYKLFASGQALGGHKRSHLIPSSTHSVKLKQSFIDLNLPAPPEEDNLSLLSHA